MKVYISGKITGVPITQAKLTFAKACRSVIDEGNSPVNPFMLHKEEKTWVGYMVTDIEALLQCDAIYMLNGWGESRGARIEYAIAREMGLKIIFQTDNAALSMVECKKQ